MAKVKLQQLVKHHREEALTSLTASLNPPMTDLTALRIGVC